MNTFIFGRIRVGEYPTNQYESIPLFGVMVSEVTNMGVGSICVDTFGFVMDGLCQFTWLLVQDTFYVPDFSGYCSWNYLMTFDDGSKDSSKGTEPMHITLFHIYDACTYSLCKHVCVCIYVYMFVYAFINTSVHICDICV